MLLRSYPGLFKFVPAPAQKRRPDPVQMYPAARPLRVSVLSGLEIKLQWFITPMKASRTPALGPHPPIPSPLLRALSVLPSSPGA